MQREGGAVAIETADGYWVMAFSHAEGDKPNVTFVDRDILVGTI